MLFGEDKKLLKRWIAKEYGDFLSAEEQKKAISKKYSGWGKLSAKFLTEIYHTDSQTGADDYGNALAHEQESDAAAQPAVYLCRCSGELPAGKNAAARDEAGRLYEGQLCVSGNQALDPSGDPTHQ